MSRRLTQIRGRVKKPGMLGHCEAGLFSALKLQTGAMATATLIVLMEEKPLALRRGISADEPPK